MSDATVNAHPLLAQLVDRYGAIWVDQDTMNVWLEIQTGDNVLLFAGDPVRFPEALDVAVVLPELRKTLKHMGKSIGLAVAIPETAEALALKYGSQRWPTLMFFRDGKYVTTVSGMHDWTDFVELVKSALHQGTSRAPTIGIPVVSAQGDSHCH